MSEAERLYEAAKIILSRCPECGHDYKDCTCYEYSDQWLEDIRAGWQERHERLWAVEPATPPAAPSTEARP